MIEWTQSHSNLRNLQFGCLERFTSSWWNKWRCEKKFYNSRKFYVLTALVETLWCFYQNSTVRKNPRGKMDGTGQNKIIIIKKGFLAVCYKIFFGVWRMTWRALVEVLPMDFLVSEDQKENRSVLMKYFASCGRWYKYIKLFTVQSKISNRSTFLKFWKSFFPDITSQSMSDTRSGGITMLDKSPIKWGR